MVFYFSGTGNSRYVAEQIADATNEELISITKEEMNKGASYTLQDRERLGFVFPIYWWGMPQLVEEFITKMNINAKPDSYVYGVSTFGLESHNGLKDLQKVLAHKGISLQATFEVKMVDNYVVAYDMASREKQVVINNAAAIRTNEIVQDVLERKETKISDILATTIKPVVHSFYKNTDHRKRFYATDACTGCGLCERNCPCQAIAMENGKPVWKENCSFCLKCIHSCPVKALQHGKGTLTRGRYLNSMENTKVQ